MDDLMLRLSETESQNEELEKQIGKLTAQMQLQTDAMKRMTEQLQSVVRAQTQMQEEQLLLRKRTRALKKITDSLSDRLQSLGEASAQTRSELNTAKETVKVLSGDMDTLYADMNALATETRNRGAKMKADMERFFWDAAEERYQEGDETEW